MGKIISKNYLYSIFYQFLSVIAPFITIPYVSRIFGAEKLGIYSYTNTIAQYFLLFALLGLSNYGNRTIASVREDSKKLNETFWEIYYMQLFTGTCALLAYILFIYICEKEYVLFEIILTLYVASGLFDINWLFFGLEKFKLTVIRNSIIKFLSVIAIFLFINNKDDLWLYLLIHAVSTLLSALVLWPYVFKNISYFRPPIKSILKHFKPNLMLFIPVIAVSIYKYMDKIMLGNFSTIETGYYDNAEKVITLLLGLITAFGTVMMPKISNLVAHNDTNSIKIILNDSMRFINGLSFALTFGLSAIAKEFVPWYFGNDFVSCIPVIYGLSITIIFTSWSNVVRTQCIIPLKKDKIYIYGEFLGAIINLIFNTIYIKKYGAMGAVIGTIIAEASVCVFQSVAVRNDLHTRQYIIEGLPFLLNGCFMYYIVRLVSNITSNIVLSLIIEVSVGGAVYIILWILYEYILKKYLIYKQMH